MTVYPEAEVRSAAERLIEHHSKASEVTDWTFFVDETYTEGAEYICEYAGVRPVTAIGRKQIKKLIMVKIWEGLRTGPSRMTVMR